MKERPKIDLGLTGFDELFMTEQERHLNQLPKIHDIPLELIDDFPDHPYKVRMDEDMMQLIESVKERGVIVPVALRQKEDGRYELISGHRRKKACELAGFETVRADILDMTRDEAIMEMIRAGEVKEEDENHRSALDRLFERLESKDPDHIALKYYRGYRSGSGKTLKSIQITLVSRLEKFNLESLAGITQTDELELSTLGERKTAVFAVIPDNDSSLNFIVGMLYTQLFQQLYYQADVKHNGQLPVHVHFLM